MTVAMRTRTGRLPERSRRACTRIPLTSAVTAVREPEGHQGAAAQAWARASFVWAAQDGAGSGSRHEVASRPMATESS
jgi:hypothetical protein